MINLIYLCSALYVEGEPFIKLFNLKKDTEITKFQVFKNNDISLIITGCGKIKASIALTYLLTKTQAGVQDILINIGTCGSKDSHTPIGESFLCNKIADHDTGFTYYPDIIFKHPFKESSLETFSHVVTIQDKPQESLVDLEGAGLYEAASKFLEPESIFFIKIISDDLNNENLKSEDLKLLIKNSAPRIYEWINFLKENYDFNNEILTPKDIALYENLCENLKFSASMKNDLKNFLVFKKLEKVELSKVLAPYKHIICDSKKEGKKYLEEIKSKFI